MAQATEVPCRHAVIHDWYQDGRIAGRYRVICYRAAIADLPSDQTIYGAVQSDLSQALSSGINRLKQKGVKAGPQTVLPVPHAALAAPALTKSQTSHSMLALAALAFLVALLIVWCVVRWRSSGPMR